MDVVRRTEHWFTRNGLPRFVDGYNSAEHIWTRALPVMVVIMVVQLLGELGFALFSGSRVLLVGGIVLAGLALLAAGIWSRVHRGYWFVPADRVGWPLLVGFLATGVVAEMVELGLHIDEEEVTWGSVAGAMVAQALLLGAIYLVTRYALVSMTGWAVRKTIRSAADLYLVATKALPLLLIVLIVLFINAEVWQVAGSLDGPLLWTSTGLLLVFGVLVTVERTHAQIADLRHDSPVERVRESCRGTPMAEAAAGRVDFADPRLERPQRRNLLVSALATQTIQAAVIGLLVWLFFIVFGVVAITVGVQQAWVGGLGSLDILWTIADDHVLSRALLRVATFLGAFAAFYTAIYASSDPVYRASFSEDIGSSLQQAVDVRRVYLTVKQAPDA